MRIFPKTQVLRQKYGNTSYYIKQFVKANVETGIDLRKKKVDLDTAIITKADITDRKKVKAKQFSL